MFRREFAHGRRRWERGVAQRPPIPEPDTNHTAEARGIYLDAPSSMGALQLGS